MAKLTAKKKVERAQRALDKALEELKEERRSRKIDCSCGSSHKISELKLIVTHWYTEPYGCTGGDYWNEGEWQFICPDNGDVNRIMFNEIDVPYDLRNTVQHSAELNFKSIYRGLFGSKEDRYEKIWSSASKNNYYIDSNRALFELPPRYKAK